MEAALGLARRGLGRVWPNPAVGCVIVRDGRVVGRGWTQPGGRPHAETVALARAGEAARGATAYVTLEPCSHTGQTGPCADALIEAGIGRVFVATVDPDERVSGRGINRLRDAGVETSVGLMEEDAKSLNRGFILNRTQARPMVTLKCATTLDGRIAVAGGESKWITGPEARARGHRLRATHDAIMVGIGTVMADNPSLTCRLPGMEDMSPVRIVMDSRFRLPRNTALASDGGGAWVIHTPGAEISVEPDGGADGRIVPIEADAGEGGHVDPSSALKILAGRGITRLLVEGGGMLAASLLKADLVDRIEWFRAPAVIGGDGIPAIGPLGLEAIVAMPRFRRLDFRAVGKDLHETYERLRSG